MQRKGADIRMFFKRLLKTKSLVLLLMVSMLSSMIVFAEEDPGVETATLPTDSHRPDIISVVLPSISEAGDSPFDYIVDPYELIYETDAAKYGGGKVEQGANLLFRNAQGAYDFSSHSDQLSISNRSNVPVNVTVSATVQGSAGVNTSSSRDFADSTDTSIYLAIIDNEGNELPMVEGQEVKLHISMAKAPDDAYVYRYDDAEGIYTYDYSRDVKDIDFDKYSFGLTGYCNPNADWDKVDSIPNIVITWNVEPVLSDNEDITEPVTEESVTEESLTEEPEVEDPDTVEPNPDSVSDNKATNQDSKDTDADNNSNESDDNSNDTDTEEQEDESSQTVSSNSASDSN